MKVEKKELRVQEKKSSKGPCAMPSTSMIVSRSVHSDSQTWRWKTFEGDVFDVRGLHTRALSHPMEDVEEVPQVKCRYDYGYQGHPTGVLAGLPYATPCMVQI